MARSTSEADVEEPEAATDGRRHFPLAARIFVAAAATLALLLLGATIGLLIKVPTEQPPAPSATPVDIGFAQDMTVHHQQAVTMATLARGNAADPGLRNLAFDIEANQREQIGRMQGWLSVWGQPPQSAGAPMQWMQADGAGHHGMGPDMPVAHSGTMPGMASSDDLARLRSLRGPEFDTLFLQLMLRHHQGGASMARYTAEHASVPAVRNLARNILDAQSAESDFMRQLLAARGATPLPQN
jgi:uncharacterized protein (DUF305 family)